jgi:hypothetical protein
MGIDTTIITTAATIAVETIAIIEALKNFVTKKQGKLPAWCYTIAEVFICAGLALMKCENFTGPQIRAQAEVALLALAVSQLGYDSIWKAVKVALNKYGKKEPGENECEI